jgi:uroporphyrinogen-III synthase
MAELPLYGKYIAITRPSEQAKNLSARIELAGGTPILFPLIAIIPLEDYALFDKAISQVDNYDWAIFISSNAVQNGMPHLLKNGIPPNLRFAAIGPVTANELVSFGAKNVLIPIDRFDSEAFLEMPEMQNVNGIKFMIFRGIGGREILAETLQKRGAHVTFAECYRRTNPQNNCDVLLNLWNDNKLHGIVVTSTEAMQYLLNLAENDTWLKKTPIFVNHERVAIRPLSLGLQLHIAETGGDEAMFELLRTTLSLSDLHK